MDLIQSHSTANRQIARIAPGDSGKSLAIQFQDRSIQIRSLANQGEIKELADVPDLYVRMELTEDTLQGYLSTGEIDRWKITTGARARELASANPIHSIGEYWSAIDFKDGKMKDEVWLKRNPLPLASRLTGTVPGMIAMPLRDFGIVVVCDGKKLILEGHSDIISTIHITPKRIFSASFDGTVRVWSSDTGRCLLVIPVSGEGELRGEGRGEIVGFEHGGHDDIFVAVRKGRSTIFDGRPDFEPLFGLSFERACYAWHFEDAAYCEMQKDWYATVFHLQWLLLVTPDREDLNSRLNTALKELGATPPPPKPIRQNLGNAPTTDGVN